MANIGFGSAQKLFCVLSVFGKFAWSLFECPSPKLDNDILAVISFLLSYSIQAAGPTVLPGYPSRQRLTPALRCLSVQQRQNYINSINPYSIALD